MSAFRLSCHTLRDNVLVQEIVAGKRAMRYHKPLMHIYQLTQDHNEGHLCSPNAGAWHEPAKCGVCMWWGVQFECDVVFADYLTRPILGQELAWWDISKILQWCDADTVCRGTG